MRIAHFSKILNVNRFNAGLVISDDELDEAKEIAT